MQNLARDAADAQNIEKKSAAYARSGSENIAAQAARIEPQAR